MTFDTKRWHRLYYRYKRSNGLCNNCMKPARPGKALCQACAEKVSARQQARYRALKEQGLCTCCAKWKTAPGSVYCETCKDRLRRYREKRRAAGSA